MTQFNTQSWWRRIELLEREIWNIVGEDEDDIDFVVDEVGDIVSNEELLRHENDILKLNLISHDSIPFVGFGNSKKTEERNITKKRKLQASSSGSSKIYSFFSRVAPAVIGENEFDDDDDDSDSDYIIGGSDIEDDIDFVERNRIIYTKELIQVKLDKLINDGHGGLSRNVITQKKHKDVDKFDEFYKFKMYILHALQIFFVDLIKSHIYTYI